MKKTKNPYLKTSANSQASKLNQALAIAKQQHQAGRFEAAEKLYRDILKNQPTHHEALHLLGVAMAQTGRNQEAEHYIRKAIAYHKKNPDYHTHLGNVLKSLGDLSAALACHEKALKLDSKSANIRNNLGVCLHELERFEEAVETYEKTLKLDHKNAKTYNNLGTSLTELDKLEEAIENYQKAVELEPDFSGAWAGLGNALQLSERPEEAIEACDKAIAINPKEVIAYINKAEALIKQEDYDAAEQAVRYALGLSPTSTNAYLTLGNVYIGRKEIDTAIETYQTALKIDPKNKKLHVNLFYALRTQDRITEALHHCNYALSLNPKDFELRRVKSFILLQNADFTEGWYEYGWRPRHLSYMEKHKIDIRDVVIIDRIGPLADQRFFIHREQGLGDEIFFLRFAPWLKEQGAKIYYLPGGKITELMRRQPWIDQLVDNEEPPPEFDYVLLAGDLPLAFQMQTDVSPPPPLPLSPLPEKIALMQERLASVGEPPYIGLTWQGGTKKEERLERNLPKNLLYKAVEIEEFAETIKPVKGTFINVQRNPVAEEVATIEKIVGRELKDFSDLNDDLETMLGLLSLLDDYVGVSNTNMHLIAGIPKPAKVLVPSPAEWRWPGKTNKSVWFPDFTVYRQGKDKDWSACLQQLQTDLIAQFGAV